jgi:hypothetical protein
VCVAWGPLAKRQGFDQWDSGVEIIRSGKGKFVLTDDFGAPAAREEYWPALGRADQIRYRFGHFTVVFQQRGPNSVTVEISPPLQANSGGDSRPQRPVQRPAAAGNGGRAPHEAPAADGPAAHPAQGSEMKRPTG